jgi:predicted permease
MFPKMFRRKRATSDFTDEIQAHIQLEIERLREQGLSDEAAQAAAHRQFGSARRARETFYESHRWLFWDHLVQDVRFGLRTLRKSPGFTIVAILTLALGIGATTAIFSVVDATLLRPLPYPHPEQLFSVVDDLPGVGAQNVGMNEPEWQDLQHSGIFQDVSPTWYDENDLTGASQPARVRLYIVAPNYFRLLGIRPQLGRTFNPEDHSPGVLPEVLISDATWKRDFASDSHILEKNLRLDTDLYRIVGVLPAGFHAPGITPDERRVDVWAASSFYGTPMLEHPPRNRRNLPEAIARLAPGLTLSAAQSRVEALVAALRKQFPADYPSQNAWRVRLVPLQQTVVGDVRQSLMLLLAAVGLVLLIGCANVANLLLARASVRGREMALRQAVGAGRKRLVLQLLTESMLLSLLGGACGLAILFSMSHLLLRFVPESLPQLNEISIRWSILLFALAASAFAGVVAGLAPALHVGRGDLTLALKREGPGLTGTGRQTRTRRLLVITEFTLSLVLMTSAGLLLRSFWDLLNARLGFDPQNVISIRTRLPEPNDPAIDKYNTAAKEAPFLHELIRRSRSLAGVEEVAIGDSASIPLDQSQRALNLIAEGQYFFSLEGRENPSDPPFVAERSRVTPEYFQLLRIPLLRGRFFNELDNDAAPQVAVVNEAFARTYWADDDPLGKRFRSRRTASAWITVVGVIADARTESLTHADVPQIYLSLYQSNAKRLAILLHGRFEVAAIPGQVRALVQSVDPTLPVFDSQPLGATVSASLAERRFSLQMVGMFALTALVLAALGIYGVISYTVSERTHEIGIRLALGADRASIQRMILRQGLLLAGTGSLIGLPCALILSRGMAGLLYGVPPTDPITFAGVAVLLIGVALIACYVPARRAMRVDPIVALRYE